MLTEQDKIFIALKYGSIDLAYDYWQEKVDIDRAEIYLTHELTKFFSAMPDYERQSLYYAYLRRKTSDFMEDEGV